MAQAQTTTLGPGGYPVPFVQAQAGPPPSGGALPHAQKFRGDVGSLMTHCLALILWVALTTSAFSQSVQVPLIQFWDPTNNTGTFNQWIIDDLDPVLSDISGGGGGGGGALYATHALLVAGVTIAAGANTVSQQGFTAAGDGGAATYQWNATSYCGTGTSGSPGLADGVVCILPSAQSASTAGRYLLQVGASLDVRSIGMAAGGQDNYPLIPTLMLAIGPASVFPGGPTVSFPAVPGVGNVFYYFSNTFVLSRNANYECGGGIGSSGNFPSVSLVFDAGVHGVVQENSNYTSDGGQGSGQINNCLISSRGWGGALGGNVSNTTLTSVSMFSPPGYTGAAWTPAIGDGIIVTPALGGLYKKDYAAIAVTPGATIGNLVGTTITIGGGATLSPLLVGYATGVFTETGTNNFVNGDTIQAGNNTYTMVTVIGSTAGNVLIGASFAASAANLNAATTGGAGEGTVYITPSSTPNITATYNNTWPIPASIVITANATGTAGNALATVYTAAGTSAGSFTAATLLNGTASGAPGSVRIVDLPLADAFTISTTLNSNVVSVTAGPRKPVPGDIWWSSLFNFGTTVYTVSGSSFPYTVHTVIPFNNTTVANANATNASGQAWVMPAALKRDLTASAEGNRYQYFAIGMEMPCSSGSGFNCTTSYDRHNFYSNALFGRWTSGNNTGSSVSDSEEAAGINVADAMEGGTLGSTYLGFNSNSLDNSAAPLAMIGNCINQNWSSMFGGYMGGGNGCAASTTVIPTTTGSPWNFYGPEDAPNLGSRGINTNNIFGGFYFSGGASGDYACMDFANWYVIGFSTGAACPTNNTWGIGWSASFKAWNLGYTNTGLGIVLSDPTNYTGYLGQFSGVGVPAGLLLYNSEDVGNFAARSRMTSMGLSVPTGNWHLDGDYQANTAAVPGSNAGWSDVPMFSTTLGGTVTKGSTMSVTVGACPSPALTGTVQIVDTTPFLHLPLGTLTSCSATTLTFTTTALNNGTNGDTIKFVQWQKVGIVQDGNLPAISSCGTGSPAVTSGSTNIAGQFTMGTGTPTACTITFAHAYPNAAFCTVTPASSGGAAITGGDYLSAMSASGFTWTLGTGTSSLVFDYTCGGN